MNYYDILHISKDASQQEIRDSYKNLIKKYHPDIYSGSHEYAEQITKDLNDAYKVLSNEELRKEYDLSLEETITPTPPPVYTPHDYKSTKQNLEYEDPPKETFEQIMKKKIYNIVDDKTQKMSKKSKTLMIIGIILVALLFTALSILDFLRVMSLYK